MYLMIHNLTKKLRNKFHGHQIDICAYEIYGAPQSH
jgi:hypothetical protein